MPKIAWTGHRPQDLEGQSYMNFRDALDQLGFDKRQDLYFIVGGALGVDTWAAEYALSNGIQYRIILPFPSHVMGKFWTPLQRNLLDMYVNAADEFDVINASGQYDVRAYQQRNEAMVDRAQYVMAVWTGKRGGGTYNCIRYALQKEVPVYNVWPLDGKLHPIKTLS